MNEKYIAEILGYIAGCLVLLLGMIQIYKIIRDKNSDSLQYRFIFISIFISSLFVTSGFILNITYLYTYNIINILIYTTAIFIKKYYKKELPISTI